MRRTVKLGMGSLLIILVVVKSARLGDMKKKKLDCGRMNDWMDDDDDDDDGDDNKNNSYNNNNNTYIIWIAFIGIRIGFNCRNKMLRKQICTPESK
jgi:hypothetical protein